MKSLRFLVLIHLAGLAACSNPSYSLRSNPTPYVFNRPTEYYLYLPAGYSPDHDWPLFVGIHGYGRDGTECLEMWQRYAESEGFVLVCPSLADEDGGWYTDQGEALLRMIVRQVQKDCRVQDQFFLAGFSAGAEFVQAYTFDHPDSVKAAALLSSGNYYGPDPAAQEVPILVVIGDRDDPTAVKNAQLFTELLKENQFSVELNILPDVGHEISPQALERTIRLYNEVNASTPEP